jgi:hypothetical protein
LLASWFAFGSFFLHSGARAPNPASLFFSIRGRVAEISHTTTIDKKKVGLLRSFLIVSIIFGFPKG